MTNHEQAAFGGAGPVREPTYEEIMTQPWKYPQGRKPPEPRRRTGEELVAAWKAGNPPPLRVGPTAEDLDRPPLKRADALLVAAVWVAGAVVMASAIGMLWLVGKAAT